MSKTIIKLTESELKKIIKEAVSKAVLEDAELGAIEGEEEEYNPWLNGDASWIDGKYDFDDMTVEVNTKYSYVAIDSKSGDSEREYFFQGDEADDIISQISKYWSQGNCKQDEAVFTVLNGLGLL